MIHLLVFKSYSQVRTCVIFVHIILNKNCSSSSYAIANLSSKCDESFQIFFFPCNVAKSFKLSYVHISSFFSTIKNVWIYWINKIKKETYDDHDICYLLNTSLYITTPKLYNTFFQFTFQNIYVDDTALQ